MEMGERDRILIWAHIRELERKVELLMQAAGHAAPPADTVRTADGTVLSDDVLLLLRAGHLSYAVDQYCDETKTELRYQRAVKREFQSMSELLSGSVDQDL